MIQRQLKLKLTKAQESTVNDWLWILTGVWNWAIRKIEQDGKDGVYYSKYEFINLLSGHSKKIGIPFRVHSIRKRLADQDGICAKYAIDAIVEAGILVDDSAQYVREVSYTQEKGKEEKTIITIEAV